MASSIERLLVATRKGIFTAERSNATWVLTEVAFEGHCVSAVLPDARDGSLFVAVGQGAGCKLQRSVDGGRTFRELGPLSFPSDCATGVELVWSLEAAGADKPGEIWAGTVPGGLFRSSDCGEHWELVHALWRRPERARWTGSGLSLPGIHSVLVDPRDSSHLVVGVSRGGVWRTQDGGGSFEPIGAGLRAVQEPKFDASNQDPHRIARCRSSPEVLWLQHETGVYRSTDAGEHFEELSAAAGAFGFAVAAHPHDPDTAWFVPVRDAHQRLPPERKLVVQKTRDGGKTFEAKTRGLPQHFAYHVVYRHALDVDDSGTQLALGSTTGNLWISEDGGESFALVSHDLPPIYALRFTTLRVRSPAATA
ncbi:MAG: WD40/YVTN/BNR-like repeat-containing protein [Myxococcota bacterium]